MTRYDAFNEDQFEFAALAGKAFASIDSVSAAPTDVAGNMRARLVELGLPLLAVPEELGGGGMTEVDVVLILEEIGYAGLPPAVAESMGVVAPMLARYGTSRQQEQWLPALAEGRLGAAVCRGSGSSDAEFALMERDGQVVLVESLAALEQASALMGGDVAVTELRTRGAWVTATVLNGCSRRLLDLSLEHARTRQQFGVPIGSFQAVKHMLADVATAVETARPSAWQVAQALAGREPGAELLGRVAKAVAGRAGALSNDHALQVHGGIGFTEEHPLHRWLVMGHDLESGWADATTHEAAIGRFALDCHSLIDAFAT